MSRMPLVPVVVILMSALLIIGCSEDDPVVVESGSTLTIDVDPDSLNAGWLLTGPSGYSLEDNGDRVLSGLVPGEYKIVWSEIENWNSPDSLTRLLTTYEDIEFTGTYSIKKGSIVIANTPYSMKAKWTMTGPDGYINLGFGSKIIPEMERGTYIITWHPMEDWVTPVQTTESLDLEIGGTIEFAVDYGRTEPFENPVLITNGEFVMGSPINEVDRNFSEKQHKVTFSQNILVNGYEVTQAEYETVMGVNPSNNAGCDDCPVENVSWYDAIEYCNTLSVLDGLTPAYWDSLFVVSVSEGDTTWGSLSVWDVTADGWRLPTEAEWEYTCRMGSELPFNTGACLEAGVQANFNGSLPYDVCDMGEASTGPEAVGSFMPTLLGLYDMHGNVTEWCWDYSNRESFTTAAAADPAGIEPAQNVYRVIRGGSWGSEGRVCRSAQRDFHRPDWKSNYLGFRVVRTSF
jgi:formylglycine-generating enzyme required for sulfatase activity